MKDGPTNCNRAKFMRNRRAPGAPLEYIPEKCERCGSQLGNIGAVKSLCPFMDKVADLSTPAPFAYKPHLSDSVPPSVGPAESFAGQPESVAELRAHREGDGTKWTPRDVLLSLLRRIDNGEISPDTLVVFHRNADPSAKNGFGYSYTWAGKCEDTAAGVIQRCAIMFNDGD